MAGAVTVTSLGTPTITRATSGSVTGTWGTGQNRAAGNILVAAVTAGATTSVTAPSTPAGWNLYASAGNAATPNAYAAIYSAVAAGGDAAPAFTSTLTGTGAMTVTLFELAGAGLPPDATGTYASGSSLGTVTMAPATTSIVTNAGEYAISCFAQQATAGTNTWTPAASWTNAANDGATSSVLHTAVDVYSSPPANSTLTESAAFTTNTSAFGAAAMIVTVPLLGATEVYANVPSTQVTSGGTTAPASGTVELWTVSSSSSFFPVSVKGASQFHVCDPAAGMQSEQIAVIQITGTTWTVVRGAENTTPIAHASGFTVQQVVTAGVMGNFQQVFSVRDFGAKGDAANDDTTAIQTAINVAASAINNINGGYVYFPPGAYKITAALNVPALVSIIGAGRGPYSGNIAPVTIWQSASNTHGMILGTSPVGAACITLQGFLLVGPGAGSGTGKGIIYNSGGTPENLRITDVTVDSFGSNGIEIFGPIVSRFEGVVSQFNGAKGIYINGGPGAFTSLVFNACWANGNATQGYHIYSGGYSVMNGCASDGNGIGYLIDTCNGLHLSSCGAESNVAKNSLDGSHFEITGSTDIVMTGCATFANPAKAIWITGSSNSVVVTTFRETGPTGTATASIQVDSGCQAILMGTTDVATAMSLASGTTLGVGAGGTLGRGLAVPEGSNAKQGTATLTAGTVTVSNTAVTANSRIFLTAQNTGGTPGALRVSARTAGTSFTITSSSGTDTSTVAYEIFEPG